MSDLSPSDQPQSSRKSVIVTADAPAAIGPYSQAVRFGDLLITSGQIPLTPGGDLVEGGITEQARQVLDNLSALLQAAGGGFADVVKTTVFLSDMNNFAAMNAVYAEYFVRPTRPARRCRWRGCRATSWWKSR